MKFECQSSCGGKCCSRRWDKQAAYVFLTRNDKHKLSVFLNKPPLAFAMYGEFSSTRFSKTTTRQWFIADDKGTCPFLKEGKCSVYEARPTQCRTFPFWPELMTEIKYSSLREFCPGIGEGEEATHKLLSDQIEADKELAANGADL